MLQLQKPVCPEPVPCSMRSHCDEKPTHRYKEQPLLTATTEAAQSNEDPMQQRKMNLASTLQTRSCCPLQFTNEDSEVLSVCYLLEHPNHGSVSEESPPIVSPALSQDAPFLLLSQDASSASNSKSKPERLSLPSSLPDNGCATRHVGLSSLTRNQTCALLQWECGVLTTGPPGKSVKRPGFRCGPPIGSSVPLSFTDE
ncbi:hypothetical protein MJG53_002830 [Ovis ammon polii x Ovis aries]|uniref:Uncharacterized protein n=1 Tax=Ovis ammon polii x Ovis aries TaxID=2918886 RepID=A0ACB9VES5_9CETA|nr:hypothetical protein MJG53_002830 [Ovis ammon polii x Ovis aries]